jgi:CDP-glucose 4,6-dehydratase
VLEPLAGYLLLAQRIHAAPGLAGAYNFGPDPAAAATVRDVVQLAQAAYGGGEVRFDEQQAGPHEARWLALETAKARNVLGVRPVWGLAESVRITMQWYRRLADGADARALCLADLADYESAL